MSPKAQNPYKINACSLFPYLPTSGTFQLVVKCGGSSLKSPPEHHLWLGHIGSMMGTSLFRVANSGLGRYTAAKWTDWIVTRRTTTTGSGRPPAVGGSRWATRPSSRHYTSKSGGDGRRDDRMVEEDEEDNLFEDSVGFMEEDPDQDDFELDESMGMKSMDDKVVRLSHAADMWKTLRSKRTTPRTLTLSNPFHWRYDRDYQNR